MKIQNRETYLESEARIDKARITYETLLKNGESLDGAFWLTVGSVPMSEEEEDIFENWFTNRKGL
jgi:hypothetical protein